MNLYQIARILLIAAVSSYCHCLPEEESIKQESQIKMVEEDPIDPRGLMKIFSMGALLYGVGAAFGPNSSGILFGFGTPTKAYKLLFTEIPESTAREMRYMTIDQKIAFLSGVVSGGPLGVIGYYYFMRMFTSSIPFIDINLRKSISMAFAGLSAIYVSALIIAVLQSFEAAQDSAVLADKVDQYASEFCF